MLIGLTGQIGGGKSTAAKILARMGAWVIDADRIGREVVEKSQPLLSKLAKAFGKDILRKDGKLNRKKLARKAFADNVSRDKLNRLVHPYLLRELRKQMKAALKKYDIVVIDAALLLFWNLDKEMDYTLVIRAPQAERLKRLQQRGIDRKDALARQRSQLSFRVFRERADKIIYNTGTVHDLERKLRKYLDRIQPQTD